LNIVNDFCQHTMQIVSTYGRFDARISEWWEWSTISWRYYCYYYERTCL